MAQRESRRSRAIMTALRAEGIFCFKVHGSEFMMAGLPDIIACVDGVFLGLETKIEGGKTSAIQDLRREEIRRSGGYCFVVHTKEEALKYVKLVQKESKR